MREFAQRVVPRTRGADPGAKSAEMQGFHSLNSRLLSNG